MICRASLLTAKDIAVFNNLKKIDEEGNDESAAALMSPRSPGKGSMQAQQPIDMSGSYKLIENHNFDAFLGAQGLPWMLVRAADKARPIHTITHIGKFITIKIEGIIESSSTYEINGEPLEGVIRGRLFADSVTVRACFCFVSYSMWYSHYTVYQLLFLVTHDMSYNLPLFTFLVVLDIR
jgi:hypothetical protein